MPPEDRTRILHMIESADAVARFIAGRRREDLDNDLMLLFALVRAVEVFGEAAARVSAATQAANPEIPWPQIVATRNRLVHAYFDIDRNILWKAATEEIPALVPTLKTLVHN
ncbi:MAG TPA: HepT-like ribonuclease domain-containing protein [Methylocella sp.]|nr:HepT-like ribonuclease domain-containing protein [Methylocella sp.]